MHDSFLEVEFKGLYDWNCEFKKLTMVPKFLTGMREGIVIPFPKKLNLGGVTMVQVETDDFEVPMDIW